MKGRGLSLAYLASAIMLLANVAIADSRTASIDAFSRVSEIHNVAISPSGARVAYQRMEDDSNLILVLDVASGELVSSMGIDDSDISAIRFVGEATVMIVFDWRSHSPDFGTRYVRRVKFLDLESDDLDGLDSPARGGWDMNQRSTRGTVVGVSDDFSRLYMPVREGGAARLNSLFEFSVEHGFEQTALARGTSDTIDWFVDDSGQPLARVDFDEDDDLFTIFAYRNGEPEVLYQEQTANPQIRVRALTPRQDGLIYMAHSQESEEITLHVLSLVDGSRSAPIFSFGNGGVSVDSGRRAMAFWKGGSVLDEYEFPNPDAEQFFGAILKAMPGERIRLVSFTDDFSHIVVRLTRKWGESYYLLFSKTSQEPVLIAKEETGAATDDIRFDYDYKLTASDGHVVRARLTYKGDLEKQKRKPLLVLSGAPGWVEQYFAAQGYLVAQPIPRDWFISRTFIPDSAMPSTGQLHSDINGMAKHLVDKGMADPDRVCVIGFLRGAYAAALAATESPGAYRCVGTVNGYFDLDQLARRTRERVKDDSYRVRFFEAQYGVDATDKASLHEKSPFHRVGDRYTPTLLIYFKKSDKLLESQAKDFGQALKRKGTEHRIKAINADDAGFSESKIRRQVLKALSSFVDEHL